MNYASLERLWKIERLWKMFFPQFDRQHGMTLVRELLK